MESKQITVNEICPTSTQSWIKKGAILVDVREAEEVAQLAFDVPELICIPLSEFEKRYTELPADKQLVFVCLKGVRSLRAAGFLINHGYDPNKVVNMKHGLTRWVERGFATKGDKSVIDTSGCSCCCGGEDKAKEKENN